MILQKKILIVVIVERGKWRGRYVSVSIVVCGKWVCESPQGDDGLEICDECYGHE